MNKFQQISTVVNKFQQFSTNFNSCQQISALVNNVSTEFQQRTETDSSKISDGNQKSSEFQNRYYSLYKNGRRAHPKHRHNLILYRRAGAKHLVFRACTRILPDLPGTVLFVLQYSDCTVVWHIAGAIALYHGTRLLIVCQYRSLHVCNVHNVNAMSSSLYYHTT